MGETWSNSWWENYCSVLSLFPDETEQFFINRLPPEFRPVLGPLTWQCASTLGAALLCSFRAGSDVGLRC